MMVFQLKILGLIFTALLVRDCTQNTSIPEEGDTVTWMHSPELIIKTKLGQRREHIPTKIDDRIYEPEYERFIDQFPVDYMPDRLPRLTEAERDMFMKQYATKIYARNSQHPLEFSLMLNGAKFKVTDEGFHSSRTLDDINQVKVLIGGAGGNKRTSLLHEVVKEKYRDAYHKAMSSKYGMDCYLLKNYVDYFYCYGESNYHPNAGVFFTVYADSPVWGKSIEPIYGGIKLSYRFDKANLRYWQAIDTAAWRMLDNWNLAPVSD